MQSNERTQVSLRIPNTLLADLDKIADALERDRSWVMLRAFKVFLEDEGTAILEEAEGLAELNRGEAADLDDVIAEAEAMLRTRNIKVSRKAG